MQTSIRLPIALSQEFGSNKNIPINHGNINNNPSKKAGFTR